MNNEPDMQPVPDNAPTTLPRRRLFAVALLVLFVLAGGGATYWLTHRTAKVTAPGAQSSSGTATNAPLSTTELQTAINKKLAAKDYAGAAKLIRSQSKLSSDEQLQLAGAYVSGGDYTNALKVYEQLDRANALSGSNTMSAAEAAEQAGNPRTAISYYQKAKQRLQAEQAPTAADLILLCDQKISQLQAKT